MKRFCSVFLALTIIFTASCSRQVKNNSSLPHSSLITATDSNIRNSISQSQGSDSFVSSVANKSSLIISSKYSIQNSSVKEASSRMSSSTVSDNDVKGKPSDPEIWMGPSFKTMFDIAELNINEISDVMTNITGYNIFIDTFAGAPTSGLQKTATLFDKFNVKVSVECGGNLNHEWGDQCGEISASTELAKMKKWTDAGGKIDMLFVDGPIRRVTTKYGDGWGSKDVPYLTHEQAANEFADYITAVRKVYPKIKIYWGINFPNWGWKGQFAYFALNQEPLYWGDLYKIFPQVMKVLKERNVKLDGVQVDNPYDYYIGRQPGLGLNKSPASVNWADRVNELENLARSYGLNFNLVTNSSSGEQSSFNFKMDVLSYVELYKKNGGNADAYFVESWYKYPEIVGPSTKVGSMMDVVWSVLKKVHNVK